MQAQRPYPPGIYRTKTSVEREGSANVSDRAHQGALHDLRKPIAFFILERYRRLRNLYLEPKFYEFKHTLCIPTPSTYQGDPDIRDVVVFVSFCTAYRDPRSSFFKQRTLVVIIVRRSDETKGFRVYLKKGNVVIISQHVENI